MITMPFADKSLPIFVSAAFLAGCVPQTGPEPVIAAPSATSPARPTVQATVTGETPNNDEPERVPFPSLGEPTRILDAAAAERLMNNSGISLQWISWDYRGQALVTADEQGEWRLNARQVARGTGKGELEVDGVITEIGTDYFILLGGIGISDTPDVGRGCLTDGVWRFEVTQNRKYWRLREFEWCDGLTDYIDIYF